MSGTGLGLLSQWIREHRPVSSLADHGIGEDSFIGSELDVYSFLIEYAEKFEGTPDLKTVEVESSTKLSIFPMESVEYWVSRVKARNERKLIIEAADEMLTAAKKGELGDAEKIVSNLNRRLEKDLEKANYQARRFDALQLLNQEFKEPNWVLPNILTEGLTILAGKPKTGKSILALNLCAAVAGITKKALSTVEVGSHGSTLNLALEDIPRRLSSRLHGMISSGHHMADTRRCHFRFEFPRMGQGGIRQLESEVRKLADLKLIVIDTLGKFRPISSSRNKTSYDIDYQTVSEIKRIADHLNVAVLIIHHLRKLASADVMDTISGTFGLSGAADGLLALTRNIGQEDAVLHVTGRDVESNKFALKAHSHAQGIRWEFLGPESEFTNTEQQQVLIDALNGPDEPLSPKELSENTGLHISYVKKTLRKFLERGTARKQGRGKYVSFESV